LEGKLLQRLDDLLMTNLFFQELEVRDEVGGEFDLKMFPAGE
jgi:hypothetical protein